MNKTCNKPVNTVNSAAGIIVTSGLGSVGGFMLGGPIGAIIGGIVATGGIKTAKTVIDTRLD
jgi:hypothetical protein